MNNVKKTLSEVENLLSGLLKELAGEKAKPIEDVLGKLADIDIEIRNALDEIEPIKQEDFDNHNKLADEANKLISEVAADAKEEEDEDDDDDEPVRHVTVHVRVIRSCPPPCFPMPLPFWFLPF